MLGVALLPGLQPRAGDSLEAQLEAAQAVTAQLLTAAPQLLTMAPGELESRLTLLRTPPLQLTTAEMIKLVIKHPRWELGPKWCTPK